MNFPTVDKIQVVQIVTQSRLVAIVRLDDLSMAHELVQAMLAGGIRAIELTLTNVNTPRVVAELLKMVPQFNDGTATLGIGSVRTTDEAKQAIACGAQFLVSPVIKESIINEAAKARVACMPGAFTPTEILTAHELGADIVKVFPAKGLGPSFISDVLAPMPFLKLMPTGGVDLQNMPAYFAAGAVAVGMGGQLFSAKSVAARDWPAIVKASLAHSQAARKI